VNRKYDLKRRAEQQAETRRRIVEAAVALHTSVGPARTTIAGIAERASVQRHTVYAHFPDERELFGACSAHWNADHPFPDPERWSEIDDPERRLRTALRDIYDWYEDVEHDLALFERDAQVHATMAEVAAARHRRLDALRDLLVSGSSRRRTLRGAIGHALEFETWRSLTRRQGLSRTQAVDAMLRFVASV
jgi:AcrR family transcriptional regulator